MSGPTAPPGVLGQVSGRSVLVLAPHYDDEVLGCGGLIAQRVDAGGAVRVLFLTDSAGGGETAADAVYAAERRSEADRALAVLGVAGAEHLGLPDGALELHLDAATAAIERALLSQLPDLVLAPSPLEATSDHRAAFTALFRVLSAVRPGDPLAPLTAALTVLLYEVNHPAYPDLLLDVGEQIPRLEAAMACYRSQEERHPYLQAALGLRAFRALSLRPGVRAVEAYRALRGEEFPRYGLTGLIRELGGVAVRQEIASGPRVSIVVRTKDRPELLAEALASLAASTYRNVELVLVNDGGAPPQLPERFPFPVVRVDLPENRGRAAAANAGIAAASGAYVGFLDDDDTLEPEHVATLAGAVRAAGVRAVYSDAAVGLYDLDGDGWRRAELRLPYSRDFDPELLLVDNYIPFHTLLVERALCAAVGELDSSLPFFEDWDFLIRLSRRVPLHHVRRVTCEYRHFRGGGHHILGERPRERGDFLAMKERVLAKHAGLLSPGVAARVVDRLRAEAVEAQEERAAARRAARAAESLAAAAEERFHRLHGEVVALRGERERLNADAARAGTEIAARVAEARALRDDVERQTRELERVYGEEAKGRAAVEQQTADIGRLYAEIERLGSLVRSMESTRAWRLHSWWHRT